jgi:hypothetical protein
MGWIEILATSVEIVGNCEMLDSAYLHGTACGMGSLPPGSGRNEAVHGAPAAVWQGGGGTLMIQVGLG